MDALAVNGYLNEIFSSIQGEGIMVGERMVFLRFQGCNLRCAYCDTPGARQVVSGSIALTTGGQWPVASETQSAECPDLPPSAGVGIPTRLWRGRDRVQSAQCELMETVGNPVGVEEVVEIVRKVAGETLDSGLQTPDSGPAWVSLTGGEPLLQAEFVRDVCWALAQVSSFKFQVSGFESRVSGFEFQVSRGECKGESREPRAYSLYLETNGTLPEALDGVLPYIDMVAMDIKLPSDCGIDVFDKHRMFLGKMLGARGEGLESGVVGEQPLCSPGVPPRPGDCHASLAMTAPPPGADTGSAPTDICDGSRAKRHIPRLFTKVVVTANTREEEFEKAVEMLAHFSDRWAVASGQRNKGVPLVIQPVTQVPGGPPPPQPGRLLALEQIARQALPDVRIIPQIHRILGLR